MKTHWLFGRGPDHILDFKKEIDEETDCRKCIHNEVCDHNMERRCENYKFGDSSKEGCRACNHHYTRYDKDAVPCFSCPWFQSKAIEG